MDSTIAAILGTLGGAIVATIGTVLAQRTANRDAERRATVERRILRLAERRSELKQATEVFFQVAERAQSAADAEVSAAEKRAASDALWAAFKSLSLVGSDALRDAGAAYADALHQAVWNPNQDPAWQRVLNENQAFTSVARNDLGAYDSRLHEVEEHRTSGVAAPLTDLLGRFGTRLRDHGQGP